MKKLLLFTILTAALINFTSCNEYDDITITLIISPYIFSEDVTDPSNFDENTVFSYEPLELNKVRLMAPTRGIGLHNLNIFFEYDDGIIEVIADDVQISVGSYSSPFYDLGDDTMKYGDRIFGYSFSVEKSGYMSFFPIGGCHGYFKFDEKTLAAQHYYIETGHEYYITVNAYKNLEFEWPTATAVLKIVKLDDVISGYSRFYSVELVSYK